MRMILKAMHIANFKGISALDIEFGAARTNISGANGIGKSSIADAFTWVLFNKDSHGNAPGSDAFREKPLDERGQEKHNLDTSVELECEIDGRRFAFKRVQRESWVKKRGNAMASLQGNVSTYYINDVETKLSEFKARIAMIADEQLFMLLGTLKAFNRLDWRKRREQLLSLAGSDIDAQLLGTLEFSAIAEELAARNVSVDDLKKLLSDQRRRINDELKLLPVRIDEARATMTNYTPEQISDAEYIVRDSRETISRIDAQIAAANNSGTDTEASRHRAELESELASLRQQLEARWRSGGLQLKVEADAASSEATSLSRQLKAAKDSREYSAAQLAIHTTKRNDLRAEFRQVAETPLMKSGSDTCQTCGQALPSTMIAELKGKAKRIRDDSLARIKEAGLKAKETCEQLQAEIDSCDAQIAELSGKALEATKVRDIAHAKLNAYPKAPDYTAEPRIAELEAELKSAAQPKAAEPDERINALRQRKAELQQVIDEKLGMLARHKASEETRARVEAHEARQTELGVQLTRTEQLIELLEEFTQRRCAALEEGINSHFKTVRWKLFDTQINGGTVDTCVAMIPCSGAYVCYDTANTAAQINACVEIVDALSAHYDIHVPLFIDGAESVNHIESADTQMITLSVSDSAELLIDTEEDMHNAA